MTAIELQIINRFQTIFYNKFQKKLVIDYNAMINGTEKKIVYCRVCEMDKKLFEKLIQKHNFDLELFKVSKKRTHKKQNDLDFLIEFCNIVYNDPTLSYEKCAALLNRERTIIYHYTNVEFNRKVVRESWLKKKQKENPLFIIDKTFRNRKKIINI